MKIRLHSAYDNFTYGQEPSLIEWTKEDCGIDFYADDSIYRSEIRPNSCALLIEPRAIQPKTYAWIELNYDKFKYVFTHDDELLAKVPNALPIVFGGVYARTELEKTKNISMISSNKHMCEMHDIRHKLISELYETGKVDCYGTWNGRGQYVDTVTAHGPYRFAIVMENAISDHWFTEKICNCFANMCVPIYWGARKISEFFNADGIIECHSVEDIWNVIQTLDCEKEYERRLPAIKENFEISKQFRCFEDYFFDMHYDELTKLRLAAELNSKEQTK